MAPTNRAFQEVLTIYRLILGNITKITLSLHNILSRPLIILDFTKY